MYKFQQNFCMWSSSGMWEAQVLEPGTAWSPCISHIPGALTTRYRISLSLLLARSLSSFPPSPPVTISVFVQNGTAPTEKIERPTPQWLIGYQVVLSVSEQWLEFGCFTYHVSALATGLFSFFKKNQFKSSQFYPDMKWENFLKSQIFMGQENCFLPSSTLCICPCVCACAHLAAPEFTSTFSLL